METWMLWTMVILELGFAYVRSDVCMESASCLQAFECVESMNGFSCRAIANRKISIMLTKIL